MSSNVGWKILLGDIVTAVGCKEVGNIKKAIDRSILISIMCRECLKVLVNIFREGDVGL